MLYVDFVMQFQREACLDLEEAVTVTHAIFSTLGERIDEADAKRLAAQLPREMKSAILKHEGTPHIYDLEEFYNRVSARADIGYPDAVMQSRAVMTLLSRAMPGEVEQILEKLPDQYQELIKGPTSALSPTMISHEFHLRECIG